MTKVPTKHPNHETKFASLTIRSGLTISFTRNISLCLLRFFQVFVINTGFCKAIGTKGYPNIGLLWWDEAGSKHRRPLVC